MHRDLQRGARPNTPESGRPAGATHECRHPPMLSVMLGQTTGDRGGDDRWRVKETLREQRSGDGQQQLVKNGHADGAERLCDKQHGRTVLDEPVAEVLFQWLMSPSHY